MADPDIERRVKAVIKEVLRIDESRLTMEAAFKEDLGADSLDLATLLMALETDFKGSISEEEALGMKTIGQAVDLIARMSGSPSSKDR
jgi:acyl carrier protein